MVDNACVIAANFGVSQNFIGLTIIAIGTSLPELVTSIVATRKGDSGLALGNAIGSNYFQYSFYPWYVSSNFTTQCVRRIPDGLYHSIDQHSYFVCIGKDKKDNVKMGRRGLRTLYIVYTAYLLIR